MLWSVHASIPQHERTGHSASVNATHIKRTKAKAETMLESLSSACALNGDNLGDLGDFLLNDSFDTRF